MTHGSMEFYGIFHGIPWNLVPPNQISPSSLFNADAFLGTFLFGGKEQEAIQIYCEK